jgi:hypothetical protein
MYDTLKFLTTNMVSPRILKISADIHRYFFWFFAVSALAGLAGFLYVAGIATAVESYVFAFSLLGLRYPARLLYIYLFFVSFLHRDFCYMSIEMPGLPLYITEWILLILALSGLPKLKTMYREHREATLLVAAWFSFGFILFFLTMPWWGASAALRDFAIVYYAFFIYAVLVHITTVRQTIFLFGALILGTVPNLLADMANLLYNTLPVTGEQLNYSMRSSYFYIASFGIILPFFHKEGRWRIPCRAYMLVVAVNVMLYAYSKTAMITLLILSLVFFWKDLIAMNLKRKALVFGILLFVVMMTPSQKRFSIMDIVKPSTYSENSRIYLLIAACRDFVEQPYGIGFGPSIFDDHSRSMFQNVDEIHSLHNSYMTVLRRTGIIGFAIFISVLAVGVRKGYRSLRNIRDPDNIVKGMLNGNLNALAAMALFSFVHVALEGPFMGAPFWIIAGSLYHLGREGNLAAVSQE